MKTAILYHKLACRQLSPERAVIGFWCVFFSSNDHCNPYRALYSEFCGHPYYSGTWHSPEEVCDKLFVPLVRDWEGFLVTPDDFIASGERVVSLGAYSGTFKATGKAMTAPFAHAWMVRGDRISRFIQYTDTMKIREAMSP